MIKLFITPSKRLKYYLQDYGIKNVVNIPYFVELKGVVSKLKVKKDIDVLYVGRLDKEKGVDFLIKAIKHVKEDHPKVKVVVVGWGPEREKLKRLTKKLDLEKNLSFAGKVPFDKVKEYYARSKTLAVPSVYMDNFPCVGLEGLANGIPLIGANRGGIPEWCIHGKTGLVIEPTMATEIAKAITKLLEDKDLARRFGSNGKEEVKRFDKDKRIKDIIKVYNRISNKT